MIILKVELMKLLMRKKYQIIKCMILIYCLYKLNFKK